MPDNVRELVSRCLQGDGGAVVEFVDRFRGQVFGLCYRLLRHQQDAEDVTQESFVRALGSLKRWDPQRELSPWLLAIAGNRCRTLLALRSRRPAGSPLVEDLPDRSPQPAGLYNLAEEVELALSTLRDEHRTAFLLFQGQELSYAEIAAAMHCPVGTAKTWVHRARRELAQQLIQRGTVEEHAHAMQ